MNIEEPAALLAWLRERDHIAADERPRMRILRGGVSNRVVLVTRANGEEWVLKQGLARLRVASDWRSDPARIHREAQGLRILGKSRPGALPQFRFEDYQAHVLAMRAVPQPHENWKHMLLAGRLAETHVAQFAHMLARIHRLGYEQFANLVPAFSERRFFESLRLEPYYAHSARQLPAAANFLHALIRETRAIRLTIVHGDYSPKNVLVYEGRLILLDYEVIHLGDPAFDSGFALTHLLAKARHVAGQRANFHRAALAFWRDYRREVPRMADATFESRVLRHTLACLLARAVGRSPLEYLDATARARLVAAVLPLLHEPPASLPALIDNICERP